MNERDIVLAELAELDEYKNFLPRGGWWNSRDVYKYRSKSLVKASEIAETSVSAYLTDLYYTGLVDRFLGQTDVHYRINGDGLKTLAESKGEDEELILRVAKWAYDMATEEMDAIGANIRVRYWDEVPSHLERYPFATDLRAAWIEGARKAIRGES
jgi:hypothetical protein